MAEESESSENEDPITEESSDHHMESSSINSFESKEDLRIPSQERSQGEFIPMQRIINTEC